MMSTHLIVDLAFCVGFALAFNPARKLIGKFLSKHSRKAEEVIGISSNIRERLGLMLLDTSERRREVDIAVRDIIKRTEEQYKTMVLDNKREMESVLEAQISAATERISLQIDNFVRSLRVAAVDVASGAARNLLREELESGKERDGDASYSHDPDDAVKKLH